jgi:pimeloyl-ACP methyl ester carboxylesterase
MFLSDSPECQSTNPWETTTRRSLVFIGKSPEYKLDLSTSGPPRKPNEPVALFITGGGAPMDGYVRLQALLSKFCRVYFYDRAGYGRSDMLPKADMPQTAERSAQDLHELLAVVDVGPPYILAGHSYGGIVMREFAVLMNFLDEAEGNKRPSVVGMVLADTGTELMYQVFPEGIPHPVLETIADGLDLAELTHLKEESGMSDEEWDRTEEMTERTAQRGAKKGNEAVRPSALNLAKKRLLNFDSIPLLGDMPLSVMRANFAKDFWTMYDAGVERGNGTEEERIEARNYIQRWELFDDQIRILQLRLSTCTEYKYFADVGHDIPIRRPQVVVEQVKWALEQLRKRP